MKRTTFFAWAFAAVAMPAFSQVNLLSNPGFEDTDYDLFTFEEKEGCVNRIAGWDLLQDRDSENFKADDFNNNGLSKYTMRAVMGKYDADSEQAKGGNLQFMRTQMYEWIKKGEWAPFSGVRQTVKVTPGETYSLKMLYRASSKVNDKNTVTRPAVQLIELDKDGKEINTTSKNLRNDLDEAWMEKELEFTVSATCESAIIFLGQQCISINDWGGQNQMWVDWDNVEFAEKAAGVDALSTESDMAVYAAGDDLHVSGVAAGETVHVYNALGALVSSQVAGADETVISVPVKSVYIVQAGKNKAVKIIVK